jgi:hypothetical protein
MPANKIQFQTGDFDPFLFHRWQVSMDGNYLKLIVAPKVEGSQPK